MWVLHREIDIGAGEGFGGLVGAEELAIEQAEALAQDLLEEAGFAIEVAVERAVRDADFLRDFADGEVGSAGLLDGRKRDVERCLAQVTVMVGLSQVF